MLESLNPGTVSFAPKGGIKSPQSAQRRLVIVAPPESVADCILFALEREFPELSIVNCVLLEEAVLALNEPASLFLVDWTFLPALDLESHRRLFPSNRIAVMLDDHSDAEGLVHALLDSKGIRGVLPMNLKLDIWLSVVGLLLRGGEYFPASVVRSWAGSQTKNDFRPPAFSPATTTEKDDRDSARTAREKLGELTERERQVLERVARGTQNKLIATEFSLSEHTIKIHIHNIIRKLRVHNRTEAAAFFLQASRAPGSGTDGA